MGNKIIIIDDEKNVCNMVSRLFSLEGYDVKSETDPIKGVALVKKESPNCVLLDIKMPKMDGIVVLSKIKEHDRNIGVIMMTAYYEDVEITTKVKNMGAYDLVRKPFDLDFLKNRVKNCLETGKQKMT